MVNARGRQLIAPALKDAFTAYLRSARLGDSSGLLALGLCYDNGAGVRQNKQRARQFYLAVWRRERHYAAASNIATVHRDLGDMRTALRWWHKAAAAGDGDALVCIGYCYYYGLGARPDRVKSMTAFKRAGDAKSIIELDREEALYHRAVAQIDRASGRGRTIARALLVKANADGDYPEAQALLRQLDTGRPPVPCRCRRGLNRAVPGQAPCAVHRRPRRVEVSGLK